MRDEATGEDLEMLNDLVQDGLIEVVSIDAAGVPSYQIASRFRNAVVVLIGGPHITASSGSVARKGASALRGPAVDIVGRVMRRRCGDGAKRIAHL